MLLPQALQPLLLQIKPAGHIWIAYSGGLDSHVLLQALVELTSTAEACAIPGGLSLARLTAMHINHGWHPDAATWVQHCRKICQTLGVTFHTYTIDAKPKGGASPEAYARAARYAAFAQVMQPGDYLFTAHQQDDQAETLLLQLFRGAGVKGLAAMPLQTPFASGYHWRPLLNFTREALQLYAGQKQLVWIEDSSNLDLHYDRNFIRQQLIPIIKQRWPQAVSTVARTTQHCAQAAYLLEVLAKQDLANLTTTQPHVLSILNLRQLDATRQRNVVRYWLQTLNFPIPTQAHLERILHDILISKADATPQVIWDKVSIRRYQNYLYALPVEKFFDTKKIYHWDLQQPLPIAEIGILKAKLIKNSGLSAKLLADKKITIRFRQQGERFHPQGRTGSHPLKKLFQEWQIPPWKRNRIPLLYVQEQLVAVIGQAIHANWAAHANESGWQIKIDSCQHS